MAVKLTLWPDADGLAELLTTVLVVALVTVSVRGVVVLLEKLASPV
jgi:hypothetical protein